ncbi:MAG TPA: DUF2017 domain-containing protein [Mycobacteriales bacterium]|nr:DUF2017 domain-containing protein [Mycobacteriales bacterium]
MVGRFRRSGRGVRARFDPLQRNLLLSRFDQLRRLLETAGADQPMPPVDADPLEALVGGAGSTAPFEDPALARLFPAAYADPQAAAEFRRFTQDDLRLGKIANAIAARDQLAAAEDGRVVLDLPAAEAWLSALNDLRLGLGARLDVTEETERELDDLDPEAPRSAELLEYFWLGYVLETLVEALAGSGRGSD